MERQSQDEDSMLWSLDPNGGRYPTLSPDKTSEHNITSKILLPRMGSQT
jgi:hypothetical protein